MCGIFYTNSSDSSGQLVENLHKIRHRGPDKTTYMYCENHFIGFHRLSINGLSNGDQPFHHVLEQNDKLYEESILICNGEIYNYKELINEYNLQVKTNSDCEVIQHLYHKIGMDATIKLLDGVFGFVLIDIKNKKTFIGRDPLGIRALYYTRRMNKVWVASELKSISQYGVCNQFPPSSYYEIDEKTKKRSMKKYYHLDDVKATLNDRPLILKTIKEKLIKSVKKRLMSDRPIGCILSGGLDSTLITAIVCRDYKPYTMNTFTIGLEGSVDLKYARIAAKYLKTVHKECIVSEEEFLDAIPETIKQIESYCTTTVRASVGNYLVSKFIAKETNDKVIFCGDVADELFGSYRGLINAKTDKEFLMENKKLIEDIHFFDVLRSDKSISGAGLEARVPFADKDFMKYVMSISPDLKRFDDKNIEKLLLREAFEGYLPTELLYRRKEAFSDGVSSMERGWYEIIQEEMNNKYSDIEFEEKREKYKYNKPYDKESLYYREIFKKYYGKQEKTIPYFWKQPFSNQEDPSARLLEEYVDNIDLNSKNEIKDENKMEIDLEFHPFS